MNLERAGVPEPVTAGQASLFFADQRRPANCAYNLSTVLDIRGRPGAPTDRTVLVDSCRRLVRATPALRLRFGLDERTGEIVQWFAAGEPEIEWHDLRSGDEDFDAVMSRVTTRPFEVDAGPLVRFLVAGTGREQARIGMVCHHLISDGRSHVLLADRLMRAVEGTLDCHSEARYTELVHAVRDAETAARARDRDYWYHRIPERTDLGQWSEPDTEPDTGSTRAAGRTLVSIDEPVRRRLAADGGPRLFPLLAALVHRALPARGVDLSVVAVAASARPARGRYDEVVGCFINEVPLVACRTSRLSAIDLAGREQPQWTEDLRRRCLPFGDLARRVRRGGPDALALSSVLMSYRTVPRRLRRLRQGTCYTVDLLLRYHAPRSDLVVRFFDHGQSMRCDVEWGPELPAEGARSFVADLTAGLGA